MPVTNFSIAVLMSDVQDKQIRLESTDVKGPSQNVDDKALPTDSVKGIYSRVLI